MQKFRKYIPSMLIFLLIYCVYSFKLISSFNFHPDFARDIYDMLTIIQGKLSLIGPKLSFGGIYSGPYYYYFFIPVLYLSKLNIYSILFFNLLLYVAALVFLNIQLFKKYGAFYAALGTLVIGLLPIYVIFSRSPWNGATYLPFLLIFLTLLYFYELGNSRTALFLVGLLGGVIATIHLVTLPVIIFSIIYLLFFIKEKKNIIYFLMGIVTAFLPLILFEVKHNFIMLKNTFITKSYKTFVENKNIPSAVSGKKNFFENFYFLSGQLSSQLGGYLALYAVFVVGFWSKISEKKAKFFIITSVVSIILFSLILRYQFGAHYLYSITLFIAFTGAIALLNTRYKWLLIILLLLEIYSFPKGIYSNATRTPEKYERAANYVIDHKLIKKNEAFNIIQISQDFGAYVPTGHEYRFFLRKRHFVPKSEFEYNTSDTLLIFSDIVDFDILKLNNWEVDQFGKSHFKDVLKYQENGMSIYVIKK